MIDGAFLWHFYILRNNRYLVNHMTWGNYFSFSHFLEAFAITLHYFHSFLFFDVFYGGDSLVLAFSKPRKWSGMHCQNSILENIYITYSFSILKFVWKVFGHWRIMNGCFSLASHSSDISCHCSTRLSVKFFSTPKLKPPHEIIVITHVFKYDL